VERRHLWGTMRHLGLRLPVERVPIGRPGSTYPVLAHLVGAAEESGFGAVWYLGASGDPSPWTGVGPVGLATRPGAASALAVDEPEFEALTLLGALASASISASASTSVSAVGELQFGAVVTPATPHPSVVAKQITTLDVISHGRALAGIAPATGDDPAGAGSPIEELVGLVDALFTEDEPEFTGTHYQVRGAMNRPAPVRGGIPLVLGRGAADRLPSASIGRHCDALVVTGNDRSVRRYRRLLDSACALVGRPPDDAGILWTGPVPRPTSVETTALVAGLVEAGAEGVIVELGDPTAPGDGPPAGDREAWVRSIGEALVPLVGN